MPEVIPILSKGSVVGGVLSSFDFIYLRLHGRERFYLWAGDGAVDVTDIVSGWRLEVGGFSIDLKRWLDPIESPLKYSFDEDYLRSLESELSSLKGKKVVVSFSGGKDSVATLYVLAEVGEKVGFRVIPVYSFMPYLDSEEGISVADRFASKLGFDLEVVQPPEWVVRKYLMKEGLPYRGGRWCTYLKSRALREFRRRIGAEYEAVGDRMYESTKRMRRATSVLRGRKIYPILGLTLLDVVRISRELGTVHPCYLRGCARVSCTYCPFKSAFEIEASGKTGGEWLLNKVLRDEWKRWYQRRNIDWEDFVSHHLWRFKPSVASRLLELKKEAVRSEKIDFESLRVFISSVWRESLPSPAS